MARKSKRNRGLPMIRIAPIERQIIKRRPGYFKWRKKRVEAGKSRAIKKANEDTCSSTQLMLK